MTGAADGTVRKAAGRWVRRAAVGMALSATIVLVGDGYAHAPRAAPSQAQLKQAEQARSRELAAQREAAARAAAAEVEAKRLTAEQEAILEQLRAAEFATTTAAARVEALSERQRAAEARLALRAADITPMLPVLERIALFPAETLLAVPMPPEQAVRGVLVLGGIVRTLEREAKALRAEQAEVAALHAQLDAEMPHLAQALAAQEKAAAALDAQLHAMLAEQRDAEGEAARAARRAASEAARAQGLKAAIAHLEAERREAEAQARREAAAAARKHQSAAATAARTRQRELAAPAGPGVSETAARSLAAPVAGTLMRNFGEATDSGPATGISYQAAPGARVFAPCGGRIVFAGPFRSFGEMVIVDCGRGYHFVLAGFERIDLGVGQKVSSGMPIGIMPRWDPRSTGRRPSLYVELRRAGQAVNPAPFLRAKS